MLSQIFLYDSQQIFPNIIRFFLNPLGPFTLEFPRVIWMYDKLDIKVLDYRLNECIVTLNIFIQFNSRKENSLTGILTTV